VATTAERLAAKQAQLDKVNAAIDAVLTGDREITRGRREFSDVSLDTLRVMQRELENDVARLSGSVSEVFRIVPVG
jgi:histidinol dehydrogenase